IYLWGIGAIEDYKISEKYSLSFPLNDNLLDRNVLISFEDDNIIIENDWLGSIPVFYNEKEKVISTISNFCIKDKTIHNEGLSNFCEFGYSVFEQTIFEDIKFMRYYSKLLVSSDILEIKYKDDPVLKSDFISQKSNENSVIEKMQNYISNIEEKIDGDIVLPTSGGYDSRILNYLITDKSRIRSFTYGISKDQSKSTEVIHAKKISEIYDTKWEQIELNEFHKYLDKWFDIYGISTHTHGMYHIEFYTKILKKYKFSNPAFLSGIIGDAWAEYSKFKSINNKSDLVNLGYTHGMHLEPKYLNIQTNDKIKEKVFFENKEYLQNDKIKAVFAMRTKLMLISYLTQIPEYFGMPVWTPFLNFNIVKATLNISDERRKNRAWQRDFFRKVGLNLEDMNLQSFKSNRLDYETAKHANFEPLDSELLSKHINKERILEINKLLSNLGFLESLKNELLNIPKVGGVMRRLGFKNEFLKALHEYYVLKAIEKGLKYGS
ncbi:MAG: hypothetical protein IE880_03705, partial [Epsilonproteobacteria bacterium]|nr:hypothetical protein [Campylobacterota bacterium]